MFCGLEIDDSNDENTQNNEQEEDDDFITVEKKSKNIYKPKKTKAIAIEGNKIYSGITNNTKRK